jgi:hypothetical protein
MWVSWLSYLGNSSIISYSIRMANTEGGDGHLSSPNFFDPNFGLAEKLTDWLCTNIPLFRKFTENNK